MVGRRDRNRIDGRILEQPADIDKRSGVAPDLPTSLVEHGLVDITEGGNLDIRDARKRVQVILPATPEAADGDAYAVVGAKDALRPGQEREAGDSARAHCRRCGGFEEVPSRHI